MGIEEGRTTCAEVVRAFVNAVQGFEEYDVLGSSRCHGWSRLDVVTHVLAGWQDMLQAMVSPSSAVPTMDAASYWRAFAQETATTDQVLLLMSQQRRSVAYSRPDSARQHLGDVADALLRGIDGLADRPVVFQGHLSAGDFLATWAVEVAVHHLDLMSPIAVPPRALLLARRTIDELVGEPLPADWEDQQAVLIGTGRLPVPPEQMHMAARLPALS